jgi:hypothetical protein
MYDSAKNGPCPEHKLRQFPDQTKTMKPWTKQHADWPQTFNEPVLASDDFCPIAGIYEGSIRRMSFNE